MAEALQMPKLGFDMAEGTLIAWTVAVGDTIEKGTVIAEIETDKATIEIEATAGGTVLELLANAGDVLPVGSTIAYVGAAGEAAPENGGESAPAPAQAEPTADTADAAPAPAPAQSAVAPATVDAGAGYPGGVKASPLARRVAADRGVNLTQVAGSGPGGRVVRRDVEGFQPSQAAPASATAPAPARAPALAATPTYGALPTGDDVEVLDISNLRKRIADRMVAAKQQVPHFYVTTEMDVAELLALRKQLNASLPEDAAKISINDLIVKAAALTLRRFPNLNTHYYGDKLVRHKRINIGIAVALPQGGLMNVVAKDADRTALGTMAAQNKAMIARARDGKVKPADVEGSTFTVSNLGPFDVDHFIAIINPPEAGILAVGAAKQTPVVKEDGTLGISHRIKITISVDHRVSDGAEAAEFLQVMKQLVESPLGLLI
ncbi:MAG: 2-oxo acid dehydrogenase subunit E2 [Anaerolineae bacterium]|nr:2-oxo acid dehydrogenase subunit E2 [Anaerolineae bacterium]